MALALSEGRRRHLADRAPPRDRRGLLHDQRFADRRNRELSYPSIVQTPDGMLHVAYTHHRQRIRHLALTEDWVLRG